MTGFNMYCKENMSVIKTKNPSMSNQDVFKQLGITWKELDKSEKSISQSENENKA